MYPIPWLKDYLLCTLRTSSDYCKWTYWNIRFDSNYD